jgi:protoheme IX farnesyltransferase
MPIQTLAADTPKATLRDWLMLTKPEITFLVTISALAGFVLASPDGIDGWTLFWAMVGIPLTSAGGCVMNHWLERDLDGEMKRTAGRPLPTGRIRPEAGAWFGLLLIGAGLGILCPLTNPLTGVLAAVTVVLYLFVYTPLKRKTSLNTLVGTLPGALPVLGGWTAASGTLGPAGWALFAVLVCWQMPHFYSLAWMYRKDYDRAGYVMLTVSDESGQKTSRHMLVWTLAMIGFSVLPVALGAVGLWYAAFAVVLGAWFLRPVLEFRRDRSAARARVVLKASVMYIPLLLGAIVMDRLL